MKININGDSCHEALSKNIGSLSYFKNGKNVSEWKSDVENKLTELLGIDVISENACAIECDVEDAEDLGGYRRIFFTYTSEKNNIVPACLMIPNQGLKKYPLAIVLQGHSSGFHISYGEKKYDGDERAVLNRSFGLQAVENGFAALCIEQRGMGSTRSKRYPRPATTHSCSFTAMTAINLGRTIIGERVWDVSRGIDALEKLAYPEIDLDKIMILGNSGGGTATFYAACLEKRIKYAVPSCSFCSYRGSIMDILHCVCNNIPSASRYFEMEDLSCLIAPRRLTVLTGAKDPIFPLKEVKKSFSTVERIYEDLGCSGNCKLVVMPYEHHFCPDLAWAAINEDVLKMGW